VLQNNLFLRINEKEMLTAFILLFVGLYTLAVYYYFDHRPPVSMTMKETLITLVLIALAIVGPLLAVWMLLP